MQVRIAQPIEYQHIGAMMVKAYAGLPGFPQPADQPAYYANLRCIGDSVEGSTRQLYVADVDGIVAGAVVYIGDMSDYGSGGSAGAEKNCAGFRFLAVDDEARGQGVGKKLVLHCMGVARANGRNQLIIHSTASMSTAWAMYQKLGFARSPDLDFRQGELEVYGFRLPLPSPCE